MTAMQTVSNPCEILCCHQVTTPSELKACWQSLTGLMAHWDYWHHSEQSLEDVFASYLPWVWLVTNREHRAVACCSLSDWSTDRLAMDGRGWVFIHGAKLSAYRKHPLLRQLVVQAFYTAFTTLQCNWVLADVMPGNLGALGFCRLWGLTPLSGLSRRETGHCYGLSRHQFMTRHIPIQGEHA